MVEALGLTFVEPLAEDEVNVPGVMEILVAPVVAQLIVLLAPDAMVVGEALNELITGLLAALTVTVTVDVLEPAALVAVRVYVVVADGLTLVDPLADDEVKVPGVIETVVAPAVDQLRVLLVPELTVVGSAVNAVMVGTAPVPDADLDDAQFVSPPQAASIKANVDKRKTVE